MAEQDFAEFEREFEAITGSLSRKIQSLSAYSGDPDGKSQLIQEAEADSYDAETLLTNIERELRHYPYHIKSKAENTLRRLRQDFKDQQTQIADAKNPNTASSKTAGMSRADRRAWKDQRQRLLGANEMTSDTSDSLMRTRQVLEETTETGITTTLQLQQQREQMIHARETIRETDDFLLRSRKTLRRMHRRLITNKLIQAVIILVQMGIIGVIIWVKYYS